MTPNSKYFITNFIYIIGASLLRGTYIELFSIFFIIFLIVIIYHSWNIGLKNLSRNIKEYINEELEPASIFAISIFFFLFSLVTKCSIGSDEGCLEYNLDYQEKDLWLNIISILIFLGISFYFFTKHFDKIKK